MADSDPKPSNIPWATKWTLVENNIETEYRTNISWSPAGLGKTPKKRAVESRTYEASFYDRKGDDAVVMDNHHNETDYVAIPDYVRWILRQTNYPNPEGLADGSGVGEWHIDDRSYTKELSSPETRRIRVTWVMQSAWTDYSDSI